MLLVPCLLQALRDELELLRPKAAARDKAEAERDKLRKKVRYRPISAASGYASTKFQAECIYVANAGLDSQCIAWLPFASVCSWR